MIHEFLKALFVIFVAEMGDKTQIMSMIFATKYKLKQVLLGVFIGSFLNHGIAVFLGYMLGNVLDKGLLQVIAGIAFIGFSIWTLMGDDDEEVEDKETNKNAVLVVAIAFFVGELGDKTQMTAITTAVDTPYPIFVLAGTVSGMLLTSLVGIYVGSQFGEKIPELLIKIFSSTVFLIFGLVKLSTAQPPSYLLFIRQPIVVGIFWLLVVGMLVYLGKLSYKGYKSGQLSLFRRAAQSLYDYKHQAEVLIEEICLTPELCGSCKKEKCGIGLIRHIIHDIQESDHAHTHEDAISTIKNEHKAFNKAQLKYMRDLTQKTLDEDQGLKERQKSELGTIIELLDELIGD